MSSLYVVCAENIRNTWRESFKTDLIMKNQNDEIHRTRFMTYVTLEANMNMYFSWVYR